MLFAHLDGSFWSFHCYACTPHMTTPALVPDAHTRMQRFEKLPKMYGAPFETIEVLGYKLYGHLELSHYVLNERTEDKKDELDVFDLLMSYRKRVIPTGLDLSFEQYVMLLPNIRSSTHERVYSKIFIDDYGKHILFFINAGKLHALELTESCFIRNGVITSLTDAQEQALAAAEKTVEDLKTHIDKINNKSHRFEIDRVVDRSAILRFVKSRL